MKAMGNTFCKELSMHCIVLFISDFIKADYEVSLSAPLLA